MEVVMRVPTPWRMQWLGSSRCRLPPLPQQQQQQQQQLVLLMLLMLLVLLAEFLGR